MPLIDAKSDGSVTAETSFLVVRIMRDGQMTVFATGTYLDALRRDETGAWRYSERIVIFGSQRIDTLLAIPL
jgi:3-phenylpropionate/cinnamic acid dioxygenase small subunit